MCINPSEDYSAGLVISRPINCSLNDGYQSWRRMHGGINSHNISLNETTTYVINTLSELFPDGTITKYVEYRHCCDYNKIEW